MRLAPVLAVLLAGASSAFAGSLTLQMRDVPEWKAVYGRVEARDTVPARARIGGTLVTLGVTEGDLVTAGQTIATIRDGKIAFEVSALDAQLKALQAQLENATTELDRGQALVQKGVTTAQRLDQLRTQVDVYANQIQSIEAQRQVVVQQGAEGAVIAPTDGKVLSVPVTRGAVLMPGEPVAIIGGGGFFLRLAIPERHSALLAEGAALSVETGTKPVEGRLAKVYPQIENGRVIADVEVSDLPTAFVDARLLVRVPIGARQALFVPVSAIRSRSGLDFVTVDTGDEKSERTVVLGETDGPLVEVLTGLSPGDVVVTP